MIFKSDIPENVSYVVGGDCKEFAVSWGTGDKKYDKDLNKNLNGIKGTYSNVLLPDSKISVKAEKLLVEPNKPMSGLRFIGTSVYHNADEHKILLPNGLIVSINNNTLFDAVVNDGIQPGGILSGEWIWVRIPGIMKLVKIGSGIHQAVVDYINRDIKTNCHVQELNVGYVYRDNDDNLAVFLGFINTMSMNVRIHPEDKVLIPTRRNRYSSDKEKAKGIRYDVQFKKVELATLWMPLWGREHDIEKNRARTQKDIDDNCRYFCKVLKPHKFVEELKCGKFDVADEIIMRIRKSSETSMIENLTRVVESEQRTKSFSYNAPSKSKVDLSSYKPTYKAATEAKKLATKACMVPFGVSPMLIDTLMMFEPFIKTKTSEVSMALLKAVLPRNQIKG